MNTMRWDQYCTTVATPDAFARETRFDGRAPEVLPSPSTWTTTRLLSFSHNFFGFNSSSTVDVKKNILSNLRPEDTTHIPEVRIDALGTVVDWNRSMVDLTGISRSEVVGRKYEMILSEWLPDLSGKYRNAAVKWVKSPIEEPTFPQDSYQRQDQRERKFREHCLFPLPLPVRRSPQSSDSCYFLELLATRAHKYLALGIHHIPLGPGNFRKHEEENWFGGVEFTLRRLSPTANIVVPSTPAVGEVVDIIRSQHPTVLKFIREALFHVRSALRSIKLRHKLYTFSNDWSKCDETAGVCTILLEALGGQSVIEQSVKSGKLIWRHAFAGKLKKNMSSIERMNAELTERKLKEQWTEILDVLCPILAEVTEPICMASETPNVFPTVERPERTVLTLKIEGVDRNCADYEEEEFKAWATIRVPASLNFFQLHRVVIQTMNNCSSCTRETHRWQARNLACRELLSDDFDIVQLGDTYFVENGRRQNYGDEISFFKNGNALRQRISHTAAYFDHAAPLGAFDDFDLTNMLQDKTLAKVRGCIHSTTIGALFHDKGAEATMEEGLVKFRRKYKLSCLRVDEFDGALPENPNLNAFLPECVRGKNMDDENWSVEKANEQLKRDRGCLRRNLCEIGTKNGMQQMPWCFSGDPRFRRWGGQARYAPCIPCHGS